MKVLIQRTMKWMEKLIKLNKVCATNEWDVSSHHLPHTNICVTVERRRAERKKIYFYINLIQQKDEMCFYYFFHSTISSRHCCCRVCFFFIHDSYSQFESEWKWKKKTTQLWRIRIFDSNFCRVRSKHQIESHNEKEKRTGNTHTHSTKWSLYTSFLFIAIESSEICDQTMQRSSACSCLCSHFPVVPWKKKVKTSNSFCSRVAYMRRPTKTI